MEDYVLKYEAVAAFIGIFITGIIIGVWSSLPDDETGDKKAECYIIPDSGPKVRGVKCIQLKNGNVKVFTYLTNKILTVHPSRIEWVDKEEEFWLTPLNRK